MRVIDADQPTEAGQVRSVGVVAVAALWCCTWGAVLTLHRQQHRDAQVPRVHHVVHLVLVPDASSTRLAAAGRK
jgi:hypothetical protein